MVEAGRYLVTLLTLAGAMYGAEMRYWVEPCTRPETGCKTGDPDLAQWAMEAWQGASGGKLKVSRTTDKAAAEIRFHWITTREGLYGETMGAMCMSGRIPGKGCCGRRWSI